jgi:hypothetical protein
VKGMCPTFSLHLQLFVCGFLAMITLLNMLAEEGVFNLCHPDLNLHLQGHMSGFYS